MSRKPDMTNTTVDIALRLCEEEPGWDIDDLAKKCQEGGGLNYISKTIIQALLRAEVLEGTRSWRRGNIYSIKVADAYKNRNKGGPNSPYNAGGSPSDSEVAELRRMLESARFDKNTAEEDRNKALEETAKALELVTEAKDEVLRYKKKAEDATGIHEVHVYDTATQKKPRKVEGIFHKMFPRLLRLAKRRRNIFLYGPTGSGKTFIARQLCETLGLPFGFISCTGGMSEGQITGRIMPIGKNGQFEYFMSEFVRCYENGGGFLLDEMDGADPNILMVFHSALGNGQMAVPNRPGKPYAKRHPDFFAMAACNTIGTGADRMYSGRNKLDDATIDRYRANRVFMDYDPAVEEKLCPNDELRTKLINIRKGIREHGLERCVSTRFMEEAYKGIYEGPEEDRDSWEEVEESFFMGWADDELAKVQPYYK